MGETKLSPRVYHGNSETSLEIKHSQLEINDYGDQDKC